MTKLSTKIKIRKLTKSGVNRKIMVCLNRDALADLKDLSEFYSDAPKQWIIKRAIKNLARTVLWRQRLK